MAGGQSRGHFYMLNMDTHGGGTHTCTHITYTHTGALGRMPTKLSAAQFKGRMRPREKPPHTPRAKTRSLDATGWTHHVMPGHKVWTRVE